MRESVLRTLEIATTKALVIECTVPKPGNVSRYIDFPAQSFEHFLISAIEIGNTLPGLCARHALGRAVLHATKRMLNAQHSGNTHLGSIILLAPMLRSAYKKNGKLQFEHVSAEIEKCDWRDTLDYIKAIKLTDVERLPDIDGKMNVKSGTVGHVVSAHRISLIDWMRAGVPVNALCYEYVHGYKLTQEIAGIIRANWEKGIEPAVQHAFLYALSRYVDNLVIGKRGTGYAEALKARAGELFDEECAFAPAGSMKRRKLENLTSELVSEGVNPGTTADLIVGALFTVFIDGWTF